MDTISTALSDNGRRSFTFPFVLHRIYIGYEQLLLLIGGSFALPGSRGYRLLGRRMT